MARIRADYVFGTTDTALATGDVTVSSPALARLPAVTAPDVAAITLHDPATGVYETVYVTAHAAAATTATISRAQEGSTARAWASGTSWLHGPTAKDLTDLVAADAALSSAKADKTTYKGAWSSGTTYTANDTAENANVLWRAVQPVAGTAPTNAATPYYSGGPDAASTNQYAAYGAAQPFVFAQAHTYNRVRASFNTAGVTWRVGFTASLPTSASPTGIAWLAYADLVTGAIGTWVEGDLNTPLGIVAGQTVYAVAVPFTPNTSQLIRYGSGAMVGDASATAGASYAVTTSGGAWAADSTAGRICVQAVAQVPPWVKVADLPVVPDVSSLAPKTTYKGAWDSGTTYAKNDTVEEGNALWRGANPVTGTAPSASVGGPNAGASAGGPDPAATALQVAGAQAWTFSAAGSYSYIKGSFSAGGKAARIGFSATQPTDPGSVTWLAYADVTPTAAGYTPYVALNAPLSVTAGQTIWAVMIGDTGEEARYDDGGTTGVSPSGTIYYSTTKTGTWSSISTTRCLGLRVAPAVATPWEKVADLPVVPDTSSFATKTEVAAKAPRTTYRGAWASGTTYAASDTAESASALWLARNPVVGQAPESGTTGYTGPSDDSDGGYGGWAVQAQTFTAAVVLTSIQAKISIPGSAGTARIGFARSLPATASLTAGVDWLGYADVAVASGGAIRWVGGALNAPVSVAAGQTIYAVFLSPDASTIFNVRSNTTGAAGTGVTIAASSARRASALGAAWNAPTNNYLCIQGGTVAWEKVADLPAAPDTSSFAPKTVYRGIWASGTTYAVNDTAESASILWRAVNPVAGTAPTDVANVNPADVIGAGTSLLIDLNVAGMQPFTFTAAGTFTHISGAFVAAGSARIGFSATKPTAVDTVTWLASAAVTPTAAGYTPFVALSAPITVTAGQTLWAVMVGTTQSHVEASGASSAGVTAPDPMYYSSSQSGAWSSINMGRTLSIRVASATTPWVKVADLPVVPDTSTLAPKTTYKGAWSSGTTYAKNDTAEDANALWQALAASTNVQPSGFATPIDVGGSWATGSIPQASDADKYRVRFTINRQVTADGFTVSLQAATGTITARLLRASDNAVLSTATLTNPVGGDNRFTLPQRVALPAGEYLLELSRDTGLIQFFIRSGTLALDGVVTALIDETYSTAGGNWSVHGGWYMRLRVWEPGPNTSWSKVADLPVVPDTSALATKTEVAAKAPRTTYRGAWASGTTYAANDTAESGNALWKAVSPITGTAPALPVDSYVGGPDTIGGGVGGAGVTQQMTFASAATFSRIRVAQAQPGTARVGFSATKPTDTTAVTWLAYADVTHSGTGTDYTEGTLNTPLSVTAGQSLWFVWVLTSGTVNTFTITAPSSSAGTSGGVTVTTSSGLFYAPSAGAFSASGLSLVVNAQLILTTTNWEKVADLPVVPDTSTLATKTEVAAKATYQGAWAAGTYSDRDVVRHNGALYSANRSPASEPGQASLTDVRNTLPSWSQSQLSIAWDARWPGGIDTAAAADGSRVAGIKDLAGHGHDLTPAAGPLYRATGDLGTGGPAFEWDASATKTIESLTAKAPGTGITVYARVAMVAGTTGTIFGVMPTGSGSGGELLYDFRGEWRYYPFTSGVGTADSAWHDVVSSGKSGSTVGGLWVDSTLLSAAVGTISGSATCYPGIGTALFPLVTGTRIAHIYVFDAQHTEAQQAEILAALGTTPDGTWELMTEGLQQRATVVKTTASLADAAVESGTVTLATGFRVLKVATDRAARVRLYATAAQRDADVARAFGTDPTGDHGLLLDYQTTSGVLSAALSPVVDGASLEAVPSAAIPCSITNVSGAASPVTVTLTWQRTE